MMLYASHKLITSNDKHDEEIVGIQTLELEPYSCLCQLHYGEILILDCMISMSSLVVIDRTIWIFPKQTTREVVSIKSRPNCQKQPFAMSHAL